MEANISMQTNSNTKNNTHTHNSATHNIEVSVLLTHQHSINDCFSLEVNVRLPGQGITTIFGHSGSGKTTLLRCMAGLEKPEQANIIVKGEVWQNQHISLATHKRPLGYVFQEASLFDHLTAKGNLDYAIKRADAPFNQALYTKVMDIMAIAPMLSRYPSQLSGGERQRIAIARALLIQPKILMMDEPLAALDSARKQEILPYLEKLRDSFDIPILYVSHSMDEVARLADHTLVLAQGKVIAQGNLTQVFSRIDLPMQLQQDKGVIVQATVVERDSQWQLMRVSFAIGELWLKDNGEAIGNRVRVRILARDVSLTLSCHDDSSILNRLPVTVVEIAADDDEAMVLLRLQVGEEFIIARLTRRSEAHLQITEGKKLWAQIKSVAIVY